MQVGAENRNKTMAAISLMVLAVLLVVVRFFPSSDRASAAKPSLTATTNPTRPRVRAAGGKATAIIQRSLDPTLRYEWLRASEDTKYQGTGRNIFRAQAEDIPKPVAHAQTDTPPPVNTGPPPPPPPPPINLKFFGFANKPGETKRIFLSQGEDVFIAGEGDIVNRRYKVVRIGPSSVEIEDVLNNNRQSIPLTQG
jgi:hypothetical protein